MYVLRFNTISQMEQKRTNRDLLVKGLQNMGICLVLMFLGPTLVYIAFSNQDKPTYYLVLFISIAVCALAIFFLFKGILTIMRSLFNN